jgi:hypothetical protein
MCAMDLHTVEPCLNGVSGGTPEVFNDMRYLIYPHAPSFGGH